MTRDEIAQAMHDTAGYEWGNEAHFQRFAKIILETEREACARVCDNARPSTRAFDSRYFDGCEDCAATIRARE